MSYRVFIFLTRCPARRQIRSPNAVPSSLQRTTQLKAFLPICSNSLLCAPQSNVDVSFPHTPPYQDTDEQQHVLLATVTYLKVRCFSFRSSISAVRCAGGFNPSIVGASERIKSLADSLLRYTRISNNADLRTHTHSHCNTHMHIHEPLLDRIDWQCSRHRFSQPWHR